MMLIWLILATTAAVGCGLGWWATSRRLARQRITIRDAVGRLTPNAGADAPASLAAASADAIRRLEAATARNTTLTGVMTAAPIELAVSDFVLVAVVTVILCALSAYLPARFAGRIQPIRAIHFR